jgi:two-component system, NarL family, nitrate/nitrite response regulator NarL
MHGRPTRVVIADDYEIFRSSLRQLLEAPPAVIKQVYDVDIGPGFQVVGEAGSGEATIKVVQSATPDLLLVDLCMPRMSGLEAVRELGVQDRTKTIMLAGAITRADLLTAVQLGVRGLVLKDATTELLFEAIMTVIAGEYWLGRTLVTDLLEVVRPLIQASKAKGGSLGFGLTARERDVLSMVIAGLPNKDIATRFSVSEETVKHHVTRIFDKVGVSNRVELALAATRHGLDASMPPPAASLTR